MKCDYQNCKELGDSTCLIIDLEGYDFDRCFCRKHLKKMLYDIDKKYVNL